MLLGIVSFFGGLIFTASAAIILGHLALRQIRACKGKQYGENMAIIGLGLGYTTSIAFLLIVGLIIYEGWDAWVYLWKLIFGSVILLLS
ncbi:MAG: hypothetical protein CMO40_08660 [Verrucomicrobiaceae bacterium]|nr:hypothetical protein [Verrucomicrobiaceae bacterium]